MKSKLSNKKKKDMISQLKVWTVEEIKGLLVNSDEMVKRSLIQLYNQQTEQEQVCGDTLVNNGAGFNGVDGKILSGIAKFYLKTDIITEKQLYVVRKRIGKYVKQLTELANAYERRKVCQE